MLELSFSCCRTSVKGEKSAFEVKGAKKAKETAREAAKMK